MLGEGVHIIWAWIYFVRAAIPETYPPICTGYLLLLVNEVTGRQCFQLCLSVILCVHGDWVPCTVTPPPA